MDSRKKWSYYSVYLAEEYVHCTLNKQFKNCTTVDDLKILPTAVLLTKCLLNRDGTNSGWKTSASHRRSKVSELCRQVIRHASPKYFNSIGLDYCCYICGGFHVLRSGGSLFGVDCVRHERDYRDCNIYKPSKSELFKRLDNFI